MPDTNVKEYSDMVAKAPPDKETGSMPSNHHGAFSESPLPSAGKPG